MKIVLDEGVPRQLAIALRNAGLDAEEFKPAWKGMTNGKLIAAVEREAFDVLVTNDKNMAHQRRLGRGALAVVSLPTNRRSTMLSRLADVVDTIQRTKSGQHVSIAISSARTVLSVDADGQALVESLPDVAPFRW